LKSLNLFYEEPDPDRWIPLDRYPRRIIRKLIRGKLQPGGQMLVFINLAKGLDRLRVRYRVNDYSHIQKHPSELACIIGKPHVLDKINWQNPILFGASVFAHPYKDPNLLLRRPVKKVLVPCEWMRKMFEPYYGNSVGVWPVGIDTEYWRPTSSTKPIDILLYDKVRWDHDDFEQTLIQPLRNHLIQLGLTCVEIRYGGYRNELFRKLLHQSKAMVFLCEHESQGLALQEALSTNVPVFAWDRRGVNPDPGILAQGIRFGPVTSVPYWDSRCGLTFENAREFGERFAEFWDATVRFLYRPREFILEHFTLEECASNYLRLARESMNGG
jgi:hypothetical protein